MDGLEKAALDLKSDSDTLVVVALRDCNLAQLNNAVLLCEEILSKMQPHPENVNEYMLPNNSVEKIDDQSYSDLCSLMVSLRMVLNSKYV